MAIRWFTRKTSSGGRRASNDYCISFILKPKGLRLNASLTQFFANRQVHAVDIGLQGDTLVIKPATQPDGQFRILYAKKGSNGTISSAAIASWAIEHGLMRQTFSGIWDEAKGQVAFPLKVAAADNT